MRPVVMPMIYPCKITESTTIEEQFKVIKDEVAEAGDLVDDLRYDDDREEPAKLRSMTYDSNTSTIQHLKEELADIITACATLLYNLPREQGKDVDVDIADTMRFVALKNEYRGRLEEEN